MRHLFIALAVFTAHQILAFASDDNTSLRRITVKGNATSKFAPDQADVSIGVETFGKRISEIKRDNDQRVKAIYTALLELGIPTKDIRTKDVSVNPVYDWESGQRKFIRYEMRNIVRVHITDLSKLQQVIDKGLQEGSNVLNSVEFGLSRHRQVHDSLQVVAANDALVRATSIAKALNASVGKARTVDVDLESRPTYSRNAEYDIAYSKAARSEATSTPVSPDEIELGSSVLVTFELE